MPRKKEKFYLYIPDSLYECAGVRDTGEATSYKVAHFLSILTHHVYINSANAKAYWKKDISSKFLRKIYTTNYIEDVIIPLTEEGIIVSDGSYSVDNFPKSYGLNKTLVEEIIQGKYSRVFITNNTLINKINEWRRNTLSLQMEKYPFIEKEAEMLLHLDIDEAVLKQLFDSRVEAIQHSEYKNRHIARNNAIRGLEEIDALTEAKDLLDARVRHSSGRVYHPLVNCPKEFRAAVVDDEGQPYVEVDLRSSQAVFLCKVIAVALKHRLFTLRLNEPAFSVENIIETIIPMLDERINVYDESFPGDFRAFVGAVFLDDIYEDASPENLAQTASKKLLEDVQHTGGYARVSGIKNLVGEERDKAKKKFFKEIFFNYFRKENDELNRDQSVSSAYLDSFYKSYPTVAEFCRTCAAQSVEKKKKSRDLALLLQQTESKFFHEMVSTAIQKPFNYFIVHDALYVPKEYQDYVKEVCELQSAKYFGAVPLFR